MVSASRKLNRVMAHSGRLLLAVAVVGGYLAAQTAAPASATTAAGVPVYVPVEINKQGIYFWDHAVEPRGLTLVLRIDNDDSVPHNFTFLGHTTPTIAPKGSAKMTVFLVRRGR